MQLEKQEMNLNSFPTTVELYSVLKLSDFPASLRLSGGKQLMHRISLWDLECIRRVRMSPMNMNIFLFSGKEINGFFSQKLKRKTAGKAHIYGATEIYGFLMFEKYSVHGRQ